MSVSVDKNIKDDHKRPQKQGHMQTTDTINQPMPHAKELELICKKVFININLLVSFTKTFYYTSVTPFVHNVVSHPRAPGVAAVDYLSTSHQYPFVNIRI